MATNAPESGNAANAPGAPEVQPDSAEWIGGRPGIPGPTFGPDFYLTVLPDRITSECQGHPGNIPVLNLQLANGRTLDLCHISHLAERWFAVRYFRDTETCDDMDVAFLPYELVVLVTLSLHQPNSRRIGFSVAEKGLLRTSEPVDPAPGVDHPGGQ